MKERRSIFDSTLKTAAPKKGWKISNGIVFKQQVNWFASYTASLAFQRGAIIQIYIKPMALDPLFWKIVGFEENNRQPLSFRARGAWVLRPPANQEHIGREESNPATLAELTSAWAENWLANSLSEISIGKILDALSAQENLSGHNRSLAICLNILEEDYVAAESLIPHLAAGANKLLADGGGFSTMSSSGQHLTFYDQAAAWIRENKPRLQ